MEWGALQVCEWQLYAFVLSFLLWGEVNCAAVNIAIVMVLCHVSLDLWFQSLCLLYSGEASKISRTKKTRWFLELYRQVVLKGLY